MPVTAQVTGGYIGYTQANQRQLPTLYFENGRITQEHNNPNNIGWHPLRNNDNWYRGNFDLNGNDPVVVRGNIHFDDNQIVFNNQQINVVNRYNQPYNVERVNTRLLEGVFQNGTLRATHRSRTKLLIYGIDRANGFNMEFGEAYAQNVRRRTD